LRLGCRLLRIHRNVELIDETNIPSRNQMHYLSALLAVIWIELCPIWSRT
jgi:hypothetical protein